MKIAIAGAGIGGLAAAALLADQGHAITVFDQFDTPQPVGSGLVIQPVGQAVLDQIGAGTAAHSFGNKITRMHGIEVRTGRTTLDVHYARPSNPRYGLAIHRSALFQSLMDAALTRNISLRPSSPVASAANGTLTLTDGTAHGPYDLIVDAAGAHSPLSPLQSRPLPYGATWATVDWPETALPQNELTQRYRRAERMIGVMPMGTMPGDDTPKAAIFWSLPTAKYAAWQAAGLDAWRDEATTLWPDFAPFAAQITDPAQFTFAQYTHGTLRHPYGPGLVHIGDAAHRASPQLGQGANMALLDAAALAAALTHAEGDAALALYVRARRWHVRTYQLMSAIFTPQYQSDSRWLPALRDYALAPASQIPPVPRLLTAIVCGTMLPPMGSLQRQ